MAGLRELKKEQTRATIQCEALRLIGLQGYETTTCEQIAAAAAVSPATLFRYYATKEDIVLQDVYDPMIAEAVRARPVRETPLTAVRNGFAAALEAVYTADLETIRQRTALILSVPALRIRSREQRDSLVDHLTAALADRERARGVHADARVAASACAAAVEVAVERWAGDGGDLPALVDTALAELGRLTGRAAR
jgi:AcrR family transcriptional regulator